MLSCLQDDILLVIAIVINCGWHFVNKLPELYYLYSCRQKLQCEYGNFGGGADEHNWERQGGVFIG